MKMRTLLKLIKNPLRIYLTWFTMVILFCLLGIPFLSRNSSGGEQKQLIYLGYALETAVYGLLSISIITSMNINWFKKYWFVNIPVFMVSGYLILRIIIDK